MSINHPIISVTGSSGAGTTSVKNTFDQIFRRERVDAVFIEGDSYHRYNRAEMKQAIATAAAEGNQTFSHFGLEANLIAELEATFKSYSENGQGRTRRYLHSKPAAEAAGVPAGTFTPWEDMKRGTDLLLYEGLHGALVSGTHNLAQYADLKIGVVPVINLEWIQKIRRDKEGRGYSVEAVTQTILRRMPDYIKYICPQFTETDINFQRIPTVDTSNPFIARWIPTPDESMVVIRFRDPRGVDFTHLLAMIHDSFMSRANSIVIPGSKLDLAMQLILTPRIMKLVRDKRAAG